MMDTLIAIYRDFADVYLDELIVFSDTWDEHLQHVKRILDQLRAAGLTAKLRKCQFGVAQAHYLGHVIIEGWVSPEPGKVNAVKTFPRPKTKQEVRAFLALAGYYRKFIASFAAVAAPLTELTKNNAPALVEWTAACQQAFNSLRKALCSMPVLHNPDFTKEFIVQTDASAFAAGAVLTQTDD